MVRVEKLEDRVRLHMVGSIHDLEMEEVRDLYWQLNGVIEAEQRKGFWSLFGEIDSDVSQGEMVYLDKEKENGN